MAEIIKSFEEGAAVSGDILTGGKQKKKIKIGVLTCGYFEYWRMYPGLKEKVEGDLKRVTDRICGEYENVLLSGMVDTLDEADRAGKLFRRENVDAVLLVYGTYTADFITLTALDRIKEKPLIVFSTQPHKNVDRQGTYENSLRNSAIIGIAQITGTLCKLKRKYEVVVGSVDDENAYRKLRCHFKALQAIEDLREANIGIIGHVFRGMYDIELSKTFLKSAFGVNIILIQNSHLMEVWEKVEESEVEKEKAKLLSRFKRKNVSEEDVGNAVRLAVAMRKISEKFHLNAMCFLDQHFIQKQVKTSARIGASLLMENTDMCVNCEGDLGGLVAEMLLKSLSDKNPLMAEWGEYDEETNSVLLIGHGIGTPDLASSENPSSMEAVTAFKFVTEEVPVRPLMHSPINPPLMPSFAVVETVNPVSTPATLQFLVNVSIMAPTERSPSIFTRLAPSKFTPPIFASFPLPKYPANPPAALTAREERRCSTDTFRTSPPVPCPMAPPA